MIHDTTNYPHLQPHLWLVASWDYGLPGGGGGGCGSCFSSDYHLSSIHLLE